MTYNQIWYIYFVDEIASNYTTIYWMCSYLSWQHQWLVEMVPDNSTGIGIVHEHGKYISVIIGQCTTNQWKVNKKYLT